VSPSHLRLVVTSPPANDAELCASFLNGESAAFDVLFERYHNSVLRLISRRATSAHVAEDLVQQAFVQAFAAARRVFPRMVDSTESFPFRAWLMRIALNLTQNHAREHRRRPLVSLDLVDRSTHVEPVDIVKAEERKLVKEAVLQLPKRQREVFQLRIDLGLPFSEVASTLGISTGNAKSLFHHAVNRLKEEVQKKES
jgi:RNA polymerase sigma-70 factor, ECF subfamily